ncbi:DUF4286 family protein [Jiella sonneratiae]|uniref:Uncharacterized protein n=1 Tax=Jiella sonneratiae TaxID=2816856 RepID=A0ABS3J879_9HYPH|nr:DUF4286 family protein [Jiella sonneratiae]MBO0905878.1 hypothetical protein [Jiella sonneratiae]
MAMLGDGVLAIWNGIEPDAEVEFLNWHVREHIPERVSIEGFLRGRRYVALDGEPKYFNFYETARPDDLASPAYQAELDRPSEWTSRVVRAFRDTSRTACRVAWTAGIGEGSVVETLRLGAQAEPEGFARRLEAALLAPLAAHPRVVGVHLLQGERDSGGETAEMRLRGGRDEVAAWILLVETLTQDAVAALRADLLGEEHLARCGIAGAIRRGSYVLQYGLSRAELDRRGLRPIDERRRRRP